MRRFHPSCLAILSMLALVSLGCCGPLACGPAVHHGSVSVAPPACDGCGGCDGCGELYIDPWINEPAACSDPCDSCGNYNGQTCGSCRPIFSGIATLWGYRYDGGGGCGTHQKSCDGGCDSFSEPGGCSCGDPGHVIERQIRGRGEPVYDQPYAEPLPAPEPMPTEDEADQEEELMESYIPNRDQQIFRRRGTMVQRPTRSRY